MHWKYYEITTNVTQENKNKMFEKYIKINIK